MGKPLVFNIQKYSIHDGRGIRTTVFFKGCPLSCKWCHNPESQRFEKELLFHADRCTGCGACSLVCQTGAISMKGAESVDFAELLSASAVSGQAISGGGFCPKSDSSDADIAMPDSRAEAAASGFGQCFPGDKGDLTVDRQIPWKADFVNQDMRQGRQKAFVDMTGASQQEKSVLSRTDRTPEGEDGVNEVSYIILDCMDEMQLVKPNSNVQISRKNPRRFLKRACEIARKGWGQPAFYNTEAIIQELMNAGKTLEDARKGGCSGCAETGAFGNEAYILQGYFNLPKVFELTLFNGVDPMTGKQLRPKTGEAGLDHMADLIRTYFDMDGHHIQFNVVGRDTLLAAQRNPDEYRNLIVRVAGYSDYFRNLDKPLQDEIIERTEQSF